MIYHNYIVKVINPSDIVGTINEINELNIIEMLFSLRSYKLNLLGIDGLHVDQHGRPPQNVDITDKLTSLKLPDMQS